MMKKVLLLALALVIAFFLAACSINANDRPNTDGEDSESNHPGNDHGGTTDDFNNKNSQDSTLEDDSLDIEENVKIKLTFNNEEAIVNMYDNPTSKEFLERLPLTLTFEDYGGFEKMSILEEGLTTESAPSGSDPSVGDFAYYAPWKDVTIFYEDWEYSDGLIKLGKFESGIGNIASSRGDFTVAIEKID
ncbi:cyclophilin-like fold protein [Pseudalkalibacillus hwajinpoensis]|uniref:cyclophilin-like fold protein n=1 Tax=Guptibacillus hwajinpoensis TaxID=208199 RepID=UPI00325C213B